MANWEKTWAFTSGWEGPWDGKNKPISISSDNVASYGITPRFLYEQYGIAKQVITLAYMKGLTKSKTETIWFNSRWTWFKCADMPDDLALLVFEVSVRRPAYATDILCKVAGMEGQTKFFKKNVTLPKDTVFEKLKTMDSESVYMSIIEQYIGKISDPPLGVLRRVACLYFKRFDLNVDSFKALTPSVQKEYEDKVKALMSKKGLINNLKTQNTTTDKGLTYWGLRAGGVFLAGKIFKWW